MEFIKIAYCISFPILLFIILSRQYPWRNYAINLLAISNILLIGNSIFLLRQLMGMYQLGKQFFVINTSQTIELNGMMIRILLVIFLPFLAFHKYFRSNLLFSLLLAVLVYWTFPYFTWNTFDLFFKILGYLCLLCSVYAFCWLFNKLPFQLPGV